MVFPHEAPEPANMDPEKANEAPGMDHQSNGPLRRILRIGRVEEAGVQPIPLQARTSRSYFKIFTVWLSMNCNILG